MPISRSVALMDNVSPVMMYRQLASATAAAAELTSLSYQHTTYTGDDSQGRSQEFDLGVYVFRLDALAKALSVIATATWLAGWLGGCLSQPVLYQND